MYELACIKILPGYRQIHATTYTNVADRQTTMDDTEQL